jgi:hypothetical protein
MANPPPNARKKRPAPNTSWNTWKPGSGRKGWSPFDKPIPPVRDGQTGHPIGKDGNIDWARVIRDANNGS